MRGFIITKYYWSGQNKKHKAVKNVARTRSAKYAKVLVRKPEGKTTSNTVDGRVILKRIYKKWDREARVDWSDSGQGQVAGSCECGNGTEPFIQRGEFPDQLRKG